MFRYSLLILIFLLPKISYSRDLTARFNRSYSQKQTISKRFLKKIQKTQFIFIPGILAETFQDDPRSILNFSFLTQEYFGDQIEYLKTKYHLNITRLKTSSKTIKETKNSILKSIKKAKTAGKKIFFIAHSLGGLALTEVLLEINNPNIIQGIIFLQTPFWGSPIASVYDNNTYYIKTLLRPFLPFLNTSEEIISYLKLEERRSFMQFYLEDLKRLNKNTPIVLVVTSSNDSFTLFRPALNIMEFGCLTVIKGHCLTNQIYHGVRERSDGMLPISHGIFPGTDSLHLKGVDHGETVINLGPGNINRKLMIESLINLF